MTAFDDMLAADAVGVFCNPAEFAEVVTYKPVRGLARKVNAVVWRSPPSANPSNPNYITPKLRIQVPNTVAGIQSSLIDLGGDKICVAVRIGDTPEELGIMFADDQESHDAGMLTLRLG